MNLLQFVAPGAARCQTPLRRGMFKQLALGPKKGGTVCIVGVPCVPAASLPPAIGACAERPSPGAYTGLKYQITILVERVVLADRSLSDTVSYGASPAREHDQAVIVCQRGSKIASTQAVPLNAGQAPCPLPALGRITARAGRALARTCAHYSAAGEPVGGERVALCASHQRHAQMAPAGASRCPSSRRCTRRTGRASGRRPPNSCCEASAAPFQRRMASHLRLARLISR